MNRISCALAASLFFATAAHAQDWGNHRERAQDRQELRQDKREVRDDRRDLEELEAVLTNFDRARSRGKEREMVAVELRLRELLKQELSEGRRELAQDKAEVRRDTREVRTGQWEANRGWEDRRDVQDDRRDRRDDVRDARVESASQSARRNIAWEMNSLMGSRRPRDLQRMRTLIVDLIQLARQELRESKREVREDRREVREDRREARDGWR